MTEICIAPTLELIRYLCLFHRVFEAMQMFMKAQDEDGIVLMAWIADAIHNVPAMLWRYDATFDPACRGWAKSTADWMIAFPQVVGECMPPAHIMAACEAIFSDQNTAAELGLSDDFHDLDLAPPEKLATYIDLCYHACLAIRWRQIARTPWRQKDPHWSDQQAYTMSLMGKIAELLVLLPYGLTHWHDVDEEAFTQAARQHWENWPAGFGPDRLRQYQTDS